MLLLEADDYSFNVKLRMLDTLQGSTVFKPPLEKSTIKININSEPTGADIFLDGRFFGKTPAEIELAPDTYNCSLVLPGYWFRNEEIDVSFSNKKKLSFAGQQAEKLEIKNLPAEKNIVLQFSSKTAAAEFPAGSEVYLPPGEWWLKIKNSSSFSGMILPVFLGPENSVFDLSAFTKTADLRINNLPAGAEIWINNKRADAESGIINNLPLGIYSVTGLSPGRQPLEIDRITVRDDIPSFIVWQNKKGFDKAAAVEKRKAVVYFAIGASLAVYGIYNSSHNVAFRNTDDYYEYKQYIVYSNMLTALGVSSVFLGGHKSLKSSSYKKMYDEQIEKIRSMELKE
jgi:hypothetical protein